MQALRIATWVTAILLSLALLACAPRAGPGTPQPTTTPAEVAIVQTSTPTYTPTATYTPTLTPTPTPTPEPTETPTETPTLAVHLKVRLELVKEGFTSPVVASPPPDGSGRLFILDQVGVIKISTADQDLLEEPFLDLRHLIVALRPGWDERGLLGLAFHPAFPENGRFFVYYSTPLREGAPIEASHTNRVSEFRVSAEDPNRAEPRSERIILQMDHPRRFHNGGQLAFGPDGYLYISVGDGSEQESGEPSLNAQDLEVLQGKILRIDVDQGDPYGIPPDNPFVGRDGRDEIFAYGFRNPYRFSFDAEYGLLVGDVGQSLYEEVDLVTPGGNYGWYIKEGISCFNRENRWNPLSSCPATGERGEPLLDPIIVYDRRDGVAVIGGYVYRGRAMPALYSHYVYGDWGWEVGRIFIALPPTSGEGFWPTDEVEIDAGSPWTLEGRHVLGLGQDAEGGIYVLTSEMRGPTGNTGKVFRIVLP